MVSLNLAHPVQWEMWHADQRLCQLCAKSTRSISCRIMKIAAPPIPMYIQPTPHTSTTTTTQCDDVFLSMSVWRQYDLKHRTAAFSCNLMMPTSLAQKVKVNELSKLSIYKTQSLCNTRTSCRLLFHSCVRKLLRSTSSDVNYYFHTIFAWTTSYHKSTYKCDIYHVLECRNSRYKCQAAPVPSVPRICVNTTTILTAIEMTTL